MKQLWDSEWYKCCSTLIQNDSPLVNDHNQRAHTNDKNLHMTTCDYKWSQCVYNFSFLLPSVMMLCYFCCEKDNTLMNLDVSFTWQNNWIHSFCCLVPLYTKLVELWTLGRHLKTTLCTKRKFSFQEDLILQQLLISYYIPYRFCRKVIVVKQRELIAVVWPALMVKHSERLFVWHRRLKALDGGKWRTRTYGTKSFVTPSASPCPSVPPPFRLNTKGAELFRTQTVFFCLFFYIAYLL